MVPGSTLIYGSSFIMVTFNPRASSTAAKDAPAIPLPNEDTTPPVTKIILGDEDIKTPKLLTYKR